MVVGMNISLLPSMEKLRANDSWEIVTIDRKTTVLRKGRRALTVQYGRYFPGVTAYVDFIKPHDT